MPVPAPIRTRAVKKALCIAVHYHNLPGFTLPGVDKDTERVQQVLTKHFGYLEEDITILSDSDEDGREHTSPTKANVLQAMRDLVAGAKDGDRFVCHISGHGSQVPNLDHTELDGMDEVFWPADVEISWGEDQTLEVQNYIIDDQIKEILVDPLPPGANLVLIFDCCHSGSMADLPHVHSDHHKTKRSHFKAERSKRHSEETDDMLLSPLSAMSEASDLLEELARPLPNVVCWSACKDAQLTYEHYKGGGEFVTFLCENIPKDTWQTHEELLHRTQRRIDAFISGYNIVADKDGQLPRIPASPKAQLSTLGDYAKILRTPIAAIF